MSASCPDCISMLPPQRSGTWPVMRFNGNNKMHITRAIPKGACIIIENSANQLHICCLDSFWTRVFANPES